MDDFEEETLQKNPFNRNMTTLYVRRRNFKEFSQPSNIWDMKENLTVSDRRTDGRTDGRTERRTDGQTKWGIEERAPKNYNADVYLKRLV